MSWSATVAGGRCRSAVALAAERRHLPGGGLELSSLRQDGGIFLSVRPRRCSSGGAEAATRRRRGGIVLPVLSRRQDGGIFLVVGPRRRSRGGAEAASRSRRGCTVPAPVQRRYLPWERRSAGVFLAAGRGILAAGGLHHGELRRGNTRWKFSSQSRTPPRPHTTINQEGEQGASKCLVASFLFWCYFSNLLCLSFFKFTWPATVVERRRQSGGGSRVGGAKAMETG